MDTRSAMYGLGRSLRVAALAAAIACSGGGGDGTTGPGPGPSPTPPSDPNPPSNPPPGAGVVVINLVNFAFEPGDTTIPTGTTVRWVNTTNTFHTVTPQGHTQWARATSGSMETVLEVRLDAAGIFNYFCEPHQSIGMTGTITVQ
ncbi:MAG: cupredoxin domain-containing protein [Gemmatimonadota bacterium]